MAAARHVGGRQLDQAGIQRGLQIALSKVFVVLQAECLLELLAGHLADRHPEQPDFRGHFRIHRGARPPAGLDATRKITPHNMAENTLP